MYSFFAQDEVFSVNSNSHRYAVSVEWIGNRGTGTSEYTAYSRDHVITAGTKPSIPASSDPAFRGDPSRWNPEDLLVAAISACHKLTYLHCCADAGISVLTYIDNALGEMVEDPESGGRFTRILLRPQVCVRDGDNRELALELHHKAHRKCFIANSANFPVECEPSVDFEAGSSGF